MRPLKVWMLNYDGTYERLVAARTKKRAAELMRVSSHHFSEFGHENCNSYDCKTCFATPEVVYQRRCTSNEPLIPIK